MWLARLVRKKALGEDSDQDIENIKYVMANGFILVLTSYPLEISSTQVIAVLRIYAEYLVISCLLCMGPPITWPRDVSLKDALLQSWLSCKLLTMNRMNRHSKSILRRQGSNRKLYLWRQGPISAWILCTLRHIQYVSEYWSDSPLLLLDPKGSFIHVLIYCWQSFDNILGIKRKAALQIVFNTYRWGTVILFLRL